MSSLFQHVSLNSTFIQHRFNIFQHLRRGFHRCFKPKSLLNALTLTKCLRRLSNNTTDWVYGRQMSPRKKSKNCSTYPPYIYTTSAGAPVAASFRIPEKVVASADSAHYEAYGKIYRVNGSKKGKLFSKYKTIEHATAMWRMWCQPRINEPEAVDLGGTMSVANYYCSGEQPWWSNQKCINPGLALSLMNPSLSTTLSGSNYNYVTQPFAFQVVFRRQNNEAYNCHVKSLMSTPD